MAVGQVAFHNDRKVKRGESFGPLSATPSCSEEDETQRRKNMGCKGVPIGSDGALFGRLFI